MRSWWAQPDNGLTPLRTELEVVTPLGSGMTPCRIDAVFRDAGGGYVIADWKTGRPPVPGEETRISQLQLRVYRRALARLLRIDPGRIRAAFHYVAATESASPTDPSIRWLDVPATDWELEELNRYAG